MATAAVVTIAYVNVTALQLAAFPVHRHPSLVRRDLDCPPNPILVHDSEGTVGLIGAAQSLCALVVLLGLSCCTGATLAAGDSGRRRSLTPVLGE